MLNKPKHNLFKNALYALEGLGEIAKNEKSFKWQILLFVGGNIVAWSLPVGFISSAILALSLFVPLLCEIINSAIERVVDLAMPDYHLLAKRAKDAAAAAVFVSLLFTLAVWVVVLVAAFWL